MLTLTIVGVGADTSVGGGSGSRAGRRLTLVLAKFTGAFLGSLVILCVFIVYPLVIALVVITIVTLMCCRLPRKDPAQVRLKWRLKLSIRGIDKSHLVFKFKLRLE